MCTVNSVSLIVLTLALVTLSSSLHVTIFPKRGHLNKDGDNLTVTCNADQPITRCQFNFYKDEAIPEGPLIDLSHGSRSTVDRSILSSKIIDYQYVGTGLDQGRCGVRLHLADWKRYMLGCRVKAARGGWKYGIMSFTADQSRSVPVRVVPEEVVAVPGTDVTILCKAQHKLEWCRMDLPGSGKGHIFLDQGSNSRDSTPEHRYYGAGLDKGECGITLTAATEEWNGFAFCGVVTNLGQGDWERTGIPVVIARPPSRPELNIIPDLLFEGGTLEATCTVSGSRPIAKIRWFLDDEEVRNDDEDDMPDELWRWPISLQRITQKFTKTLRGSDNGRVLKCEVSHVALKQPLVATRTLHITSVNVCPPLTSESVIATCYLGTHVRNCSLPQETGVVAELSCKPGFAYPANVYYRRITCNHGGKWSRRLFTCIPDCGRRKTNSGVTLVSGGKESKIGEFPWHTAIYENTGGNQKHICGGTIISSNVVISAAHCFWQPGSHRAGNAVNYKVAAGKQLRLWDEPDPNVQKRDVLEIHTHKRFRERETNFAGDIAIVILVEPFQITARVNLVCIDWDNDFENRQLVPGAVGTAAGWGYTEDGVQSDNLLYVDLPYIPVDICLDALANQSRQLLTPDKFCAGYTNKSTSVCRGDSGGGLVFKDPISEKHYLRGIVSVAFPPPENRRVCYSELYTGFTKFSLFIPWVQDNI